MLRGANPQEKDLVEKSWDLGLIPLVHLGLGKPPWAAFQVLVDFERGEPPAARNPEMNRLC